MGAGGKVLHLPKGTSGVYALSAQVVECSRGILQQKSCVGGWGLENDRH